MSGVRLLTPPGSGGVAVIEVRGAVASACLGELVSRSLPGSGCSTLVHVLPARGIGAPAEVLDEALLLCRAEGWFELCLHGNPLLVAELLRRLGGETTPARMTLEQRALELVPEAASELGARVLLDQARGALRREVLALEHGTLADARELHTRWRRLAPLLVPPMVVLVGPTNAGKSTLFNLLVGEDRVTVAREAGTTRDTISAPALLGPLEVLLVDTAGERHLGGAGELQDVEREGQRLARELVVRADLVLRLSPAGQAAPAPQAGEVSLVSQCDLLGEAPDAWPAGGLSALACPEGARKLVERRVLGEFDLLAGGALWVKGRGVPFEQELARALVEACQHPPGTGRRGRLQEVLQGECGHPIATWQ